ncbi:hypothetical protein RB595_000837 [Gaeumannomyces hyphopodioides]
MEHQPPDVRIRSSWHARAAAGEPFAVVRVRNLQATVHAAQDAWGRSAKAQPLLVSAEVSLGDPFEASSAADKVAADTVHYGILSKAILASLERYQQPPGRDTEPAGADDGRSLRGVLETIWSGLTGLTVEGARSPSRAGDKAPLLDTSRVRSMSVTVTLPKASLLGDGVSLTATSVFEQDGSLQRVAVFGICLRLHGLRVPTLIGVNPNERLAKQFVVTEIEVDKFDYAPDAYTTLEALAVKIIGESTFETLEALGSHLARTIISDFKPLAAQTYSGPLGWQVKISMEKPTAVPFADAPSVEIRAGAGGPHDIHGAQD